MAKAMRLQTEARSDPRVPIIGRSFEKAEGVVTDFRLSAPGDRETKKMTGWLSGWPKMIHAGIILFRLESIA